MREIIGWSCAIILGVTLAGGLVIGVIDAVMSKDPIGAVFGAVLIFLILSIGAAWGLS